MTKPRARAANAKDFLGYLEEFHPGTGAHLRAALPREVMEAVEGTVRTDWNGIDLDGVYVSAIVAWLGPDRARAAWRQFTSERFIKTPAIRAIAEGAIRVFWVSVKSLVRMIPLAFQQGFRDCGTVQVALSDREATVTITDLAPELVRHDAYLVLFHGVFLGIYDIVRAEPSLDFRPDLRARRLEARFRW